jgi:hypothetical protein
VRRARAPPAIVLPAAAGSALQVLHALGPLKEVHERMGTQSIVRALHNTRRWGRALAEVVAVVAARIRRNGANKYIHLSLETKGAHVFASLWVAHVKHPEFWTAAPSDVQCLALINLHMQCACATCQSVCRSVCWCLHLVPSS